MSGKDTDKKKLNEQFLRIWSGFSDYIKARGLSFCFVREEYLSTGAEKDLNAASDRDFRAAEECLRSCSVPLSYWHAFLKTRDPGVLEEVPALTGAAIAAAAWVFLMPRAEFCMGFNCDKYDRLSIDFYWTLDPEHPLGCFESCVEKR